MSGQDDKPKNEPPSAAEEETERTVAAEDLRLMPRRGQKPWLMVIGGRSCIGMLFEVSGKMTLGRSDDVDVVLDEDGVSRRHATVDLLAGSVVRISDLGSSNGVRVGGRLVKTHALRAGERVRLGNAVLTLLHIDDDLQAFSKNLHASANAMIARK